MSLSQSYERNPQPKKLKTIQRDLRNNLTSAEATLWKHLKGSKQGKKFRRQHSVGNFILDFYCATERIAIELDGAHHFTDEGIKYDEARTKYLNSLNIKVIRFENVRVFEDLVGGLKEIKACFYHPDSAGAESVPPEAGGKNAGKFGVATPREMVRPEVVERLKNSVRFCNSKDKLQIQYQITRFRQCFAHQHHGSSPSLFH